ncbi:hypothetical protein ACFLQX_01850 [Bacteroidota bacterium]
MKYSMKNIAKALLGIACVTILSCCIGPAGPPGQAGLDGDDGAAGPAGPPGADGSSGADGMDANENCIICHNDGFDLIKKQEQFSLSRHDSLNYGGWERASCSPCHTHQGFTEIMATGNEDASEDLDFVLGIKCRTCHLIHTNYDMLDWGLVTSLSVDLRLGGTTADFGEKSNICINCHQARGSYDLPVVGGDSIDVNSSHWGLHHGPESNLMLGEGGYEIAGSTSYPVDGSNSHINEGCVICHLGQTSDHTFQPGKDACLPCHDDIDIYIGFDYEGVQTTVETALNGLSTILIAKGWLTPDGYPSINRLHADDAGVLLNYLAISEDGSMGIHNPAYILALLNNSLEYISP